MPVDVQKIKQRYTSLAADKQLSVGTWRECYQWTNPARGDGLDCVIISATDAQSQKARIFDSTAPESLKVGVSTLMGGMVPANSRWFDMDVGHESDEERAWLDTMARFMWENIHAANFDSEAFDSLLDAFTAGWFVMYMDEAEEGGFYFESWPIGQCCIASSRAAGVIDTVYRQFEMTISQLVAEYGLDNISESSREKYQTNKLDEKVCVLLAIEPREVYAVGARFGKNMPFSACHIEVNSNHVLREGGYQEFPCMVPRWYRLPNSPYATGPVADALPTIKTLNDVFKWVLMGMESTQAPMMIAEDDGVLNPRNIKMGPRKIIVANSVESVKPLLTGANPDAGAIAIDGMQSTVRKILMADQLPPVEVQAKTAYEWQVRVQTLRQMMGPMFGRFQAEFLQPLIERAFGIVWRANIRSRFALVGQPPQTLLNRSFTVRYLSPLARAQKLEDVSAMDVYEADLANKAQALQDPSILDVYDWEEAAREKAQLRGIKQTLIRDARMVMQMRQQRQEAQAQAQQQAMAAQGQAEMQGAMAQRVARAA